MTEDYIENINERGSYPDPVEEIEPLPESDMSRLAVAMGRLFQFFCASGDMNVIGKRVLTVCWNMRPDMLPDVRSEAELARALGVTRADLNKILNEFRDTFGVRTMTMRNEETRERCRTSQLKRSRQ